MPLLPFHAQQVACPRGCVHKHHLQDFAIHIHALLHLPWGDEGQVSLVGAGVPGQQVEGGGKARGDKAVHLQVCIGPTGPMT